MRGRKIDPVVERGQEGLQLENSKKSPKSLVIIGIVKKKVLMR